MPLKVEDARDRSWNWEKILRCGSILFAEIRHNKLDGNYPKTNTMELKQHLHMFLGLEVLGLCPVASISGEGCLPGLWMATFLQMPSHGLSLLNACRQGTGRVHSGVSFYKGIICIMRTLPSFIHSYLSMAHL